MKHEKIRLGKTAAVSDSFTNGTECQFCQNGTLQHIRIQRYGYALACNGGLLVAIPTGFILATIGAHLLSVFLVLQSSSDPDRFLWRTLVKLPFYVFPLLLLALVPASIGAFFMRTKQLLKCSACETVIDSS